MKIVDLRNKHIAGFQRELRAARPGDVDNIAQLPDAMFYEIANRAAFNAGWFGEATEQELDDLTYRQAEKLATEIWTAYNEARTVDPNSPSSPPMQ